MIEKLRECFDEMVVYKDLKKSTFLTTLKLPSYLRDWLMKKFQDEDGEYDVEEVTDFVKTYLPDKDAWVRIKDRIMTENEHVRLLTRISVDLSIKDQEISFALPEFGLTNKETIIEPHVWEECKGDLISANEVWGVVELGYRLPNEAMKLKGKIKLVSFTNFCPYTVDLDYYKDAREEFSINEWLDILLGAIDYNGSAYESESQKITMLSRLLPFVENNLNLIELAPKGTGKSYVFGNVSRYGLLTDGGKVTRAKMFYDAARRTPGFIVGNDYVAIDEVKLVTFGDVSEMRSIMQGYMERGSFNFGGYEGKSSAGVVFLGNIDEDNMDEYSNMLTELPQLFQESALLDRIHGFIKGWDIPPMKDSLKVSGWALNSEYFSSIMHLLRGDVSYRAIVDQLVETSENGYIRHTEAVKRLATAYLKLFFPNVRTAEDITTKDFQRYCLRPAVKMRNIIQIQLSILDKEYKQEERQMPTFTIREIHEEN